MKHIQMFTNPGSVIIDVTSGTGTAAVRLFVIHLSNPSFYCVNVV